MNVWIVSSLGLGKAAKNICIHVCFLFFFNGLFKIPLGKCIGVELLGSTATVYLTIETAEEISKVAAPFCTPFSHVFQVLHMLTNTC